MKKFYLHDGANQMGPFGIDDLKTMGINIETPIWYEGLSEWTTVGKVPELNALFNITAPPPFSSRATYPSPNQESLSHQEYTYKPEKQGSSIGKKLLILAGTVVLVLIGIYIYNQVERQRYENARQNLANAEEDAKARIRNNITSYVTAERSGYQYNSLGGIYNLSISVNNNTSYIIDNAKVKVVYIKANGDIWDTRIVDFNLINPQSKATIRVPDTNRGTSVTYEIVSIKSSALGLY